MCVWGVGAGVDVACGGGLLSGGMCVAVLTCLASGGPQCLVTLLHPPNDMFTRMPLNDHLVSDHCPAPYEKCLEALLLQAGGSVPDPEGWVALFQGRQRTGLTSRHSYQPERVAPA